MLPCDEVVSQLRVYDQVNLDKPGMFVSSRKKTVPFPEILQHTRQRGLQMLQVRPTRSGRGQCACSLLTGACHVTFRFSAFCSSRQQVLLF